MYILIYHLNPLCNCKSITKLKRMMKMVYIFGYVLIKNVHFINLNLFLTTVYLLLNI